MARQFAAKGRDLALCARRVDNLDELKAELQARHPNIKVAVAALDVNDHDQVPKVFGELSDELAKQIESAVKEFQSQYASGKTAKHPKPEREAVTV